MIDAGGTGRAGKIAPFWIQTFTGRAFDLSNPMPQMVDVEDIAHALAQINRYTGHAAWPYSVAQHSIMVAEIVAATAPGLALGALLHDAGEAYTGDLSSPFKALMREHCCEASSPADDIADRVDHAIRLRFRLLYNYPADALARAHATIKQADLIALATEKRDLFGPPPCEGWGDATGFVLPEPLDRPCERWWWVDAKARFLDAFDRFGGVR